MIPSKLVRRDQILLNEIQTQSVSAVSSMLPDLETLSQNGAGAVFREVATGTLDRFGNVATVASTASYGDMRASVLPLERELNTVATFTLNLETVEPVVGYAMSKFVAGDYAMAGTQLAASVGLAVANTYRDNTLKLVESDPVAYGVQRVARPGACAFCAYSAAHSNPEWRGGSFQHLHKYHEHCSCSVVPLYKNVTPFMSRAMREQSDEARGALGILRTRQDTMWKSFKEQNPDARKRDFFKNYPQASVTMKNALRVMRNEMGYN